MAKKNDDAIPFTTPFGTARFAKISKADTEGKYADGKFKTYVEFEDEDLETVRAALKAAAVEFHGTSDNIQLPIKGVKNKEKTAIAFVGVEMKSKFRPACFDSKKKKLPNGATVGSGSIIRVASAFFPWEKEEKVIIKGEDGSRVETKEMVYGVSMRLGDVQVRKLAAGGSNGTGAAFDEVEDGFEYDGEDSDKGGDQFDAADL
jgi:hypothetical protein